MNNVRCVPLTAEDVQPYTSHAVGRLFLQHHLYVGELCQGRLPSPRIENGTLIFRLKPLIEYQRLLAMDPADPGVSLLEPDDKPIRGTLEENFQRFAHREPRKNVWDDQPDQTLSVPLGNGWVVIFSLREHDIRDVRKMLQSEIGIESIG